VSPRSGGGRVSLRLKRGLFWKIEGERVNPGKHAHLRTGSRSVRGKVFQGRFLPGQGEGRESSPSRKGGGGGHHQKACIEVGFWRRTGARAVSSAGKEKNSFHNNNGVLNPEGKRKDVPCIKKNLIFREKGDDN